MKYVLSKE